MGRNRKGTEGTPNKRGGRWAETTERRDLVRRLLVAGMSEAAIVRQLEAGVPLERVNPRDPEGPMIPVIDPKTQQQRVIKAGRPTTYRDFQEIGAEYRDLLADPTVRARALGTIRERLQRLARKAEAAGDYSAAIQAIKVEARLMGLFNTTTASQTVITVESNEAGASGKAVAATVTKELTGPVADDPIVARAVEIRTMTDEELDADLGRQLERAGRLKLLPGGRTSS